MALPQPAARRPVGRRAAPAVIRLFRPIPTRQQPGGNQRDVLLCDRRAGCDPPAALGEGRTRADRAVASRWHVLLHRAGRTVVRDDGIGGEDTRVPTVPKSRPHLSWASPVVVDRGCPQGYHSRAASAAHPRGAAGGRRRSSNGRSVEQPGGNASANRVHSAHRSDRRIRLNANHS